MFRVVIREAQRFGDLPRSDFSGGPLAPGGGYAHEQWRQIGPSMSQPLFTVNVLPIAQAVGRAAAAARRARGGAEAREQVRRAIAEYCATAAADRAVDYTCAMSPAIR